VTTSDDPDRDPVVRRLREEISDNDLTIVNAINARLALVRRLRDYKASRGWEFVDQAREDWMLAYVTRANRGPLSAEGLREIYEELLDLTKREVAGEAEQTETAP
jgi:chorismate mutase